MNNIYKTPYEYFSDNSAQGRGPNIQNIQNLYAISDQEITTKYKCYTCLLYIYVIFSIMSFFIEWENIPFAEFMQIMKLAYYLLVIVLWIIGIHAFNRKSSSVQWIFQNGLVVVMALDLIDLFKILMNSYTYNPFITFTMLGTQVISRIILPFFIYTSGTTLRKTMEERERALSKLNSYNAPITRL